MPQPTAYSKTTNFAQDEANNVGGRSTVRTANLDAEFRNIETALGETQTSLARLQRDDGKLKDGIVELYSLSSAARASLQVTTTARGTWAPAVVYAGNDLVMYGGLSYLCLEAHTSAGLFSSDLSAGKWQVFLFDDGAFRPEMFGAVGDGIADDSAALSDLSAAVNAAGGGVIALRPGATYLIGGQTLVDPAVGNYRIPPNVYIPLDIRDCARGVVIRGNGAVIKCMDGAKYGTFNEDGTVLNPSMPYFGVGIATPYTHMIYVSGCKGVHIENLELDGNILNAEIGGTWGDTGRQIGMTGFALYDNTGPISVENVYTHHHGLDGIIVNGPSEDVTFPKENASITAVRSECNGRQGCSIVGGKGWSFRDCTFSWTGKANAGSATVGPVGSNPGAGVDLEAEGGKEVRDIAFHNCEFIGNRGQAVVADSGTDVDRVSFYDCTFVGISGYVLWLNRPGFRLYRCIAAGTCVVFWPGTSGTISPTDAVYAEDCIFTNDVAYSPTGTLFVQNDLIFETVLGFVSCNRCTFIYNSTASIGGGVGNFLDHEEGYGIHFTDCKFVGKDGAFSAYGQFYGTNYFIEDGGAIGAAPGVGVEGAAAEVSATAVAGPSFGVWYFHRAGTTTRYPATHDGNLNGIGSRAYATDGDVTVTHIDDKSTQLLTGAITADRTVTLAGGKRGASFRFVRTGAGAFNWSIGGLKNLAVDEWCEVEHSGSAWALTAFGSL